MRSGLRTYRTFVASLTLLLTLGLLLPLVQHACAMGLMEMGVLECCCDDMAMPMPMDMDAADCHNAAEMPSSNEGDACCTVSVTTYTPPPLVLPTPPEAPMAVAALPLAIAAVALPRIDATTSPPLRRVLPPSAPPVRILYGAFLN